MRSAEAKEKHRLYMIEWRRTHREDYLEQQKKYRETHKEKISECHKKYYQENKEKCNEAKRKWKHEHKEDALKRKYSNYDQTRNGRNRGKRWQKWEEDLVINSNKSDRELSEILGRGALAIQIKRSRLIDRGM